MVASCPHRSPPPQSFQMRCQRPIIGVRWFDFISNSSISSATGQGDVKSATRLALLGHMARRLKGSGRHSESQGWRRAISMRASPCGCPRSTWVDHAKEDVAIRLDSVMLLAADRRQSLEKSLLRFLANQECLMMMMMMMMHWSGCFAPLAPNKIIEGGLFPFSP